MKVHWLLGNLRIFLETGQKVLIFASHRKDVSWLSEKIGEITIEEQHGAFVGLKASSNMDLSVAFDVIEQNKASLHILDYSVSQATLEQIFIEFAKKGSDEREKDDEQDQPLSL